MAEKMVFRAGDERHLFYTDIVEYKYYGGFAKSQRQKCVMSLHDSIRSRNPEARILEISSKSLQEEGIRLSAFNLGYTLPDGSRVPVECVFQSSKKFAEGGPYTDLLLVTPREAKKDVRLRESGPLEAFVWEGKTWPLIPQTFFYDWIYIKALHDNPELAGKVLEYDTFTDIEFNHKKSINCQARSAAIYKTLVQRGLVEEVIKDAQVMKGLYI